MHYIYIAEVRLRRLHHRRKAEDASIVSIPKENHVTQTRGGAPNDAQAPTVLSRLTALLQAERYFHPPGDKVEQVCSSRRAWDFLFEWKHPTIQNGASTSEKNNNGTHSESLVFWKALDNKQQANNRLWNNVGGPILRCTPNWSVSYQNVPSFHGA